MFASDNDVLLQTRDLPTNSFGFYNTSMGFRVVNNPGGSNGDLCIAGAPTGRYVGPGRIQNSGLTGEFQLALDLNSMPQPTGTVAVAPGETWFFQARLRFIRLSALPHRGLAALADPPRESFELASRRSFHVDPGPAVRGPNLVVAGLLAVQVHLHTVRRHPLHG